MIFFAVEPMNQFVPFYHSYEAHGVFGTSHNRFLPMRRDTRYLVPHNYGKS
jgi:hypothetical protein